MTSYNHLLLKLKHIKIELLDPDPGSLFGIRIPEAAEYGSNADPDPKH